MHNLKWLLQSGAVTVDQLGGGLDKLNFAVQSRAASPGSAGGRAPEGFFIWQLSSKALVRQRHRILQKLSEHLGKQGVATRRLVPGSLQILPRSSLRWSAVYFGVPGQTISWSDYSLPLVSAAVKYLERIHQAGRSFPDRAELDRVELSDPPVLPAAELTGCRVNRVAWRQRAERLACLNQGQKTATVLHGDYGRANIIFDGERVAGVVDFDRAAWGHPVFDLGRFVSYLLLDTPLSKGAVYQTVCSSYQPVAVTPADLKLATEWAWWTDWLAWRRTSSDLRGKLEKKLITSGVIKPI